MVDSRHVRPQELMNCGWSNNGLPNLPSWPNTKSGKNLSPRFQPFGGKLGWKKKQMSPQTQFEYDQKQTAKLICDFFGGCLFLFRFLSWKLDFNHSITQSLTNSKIHPAGENPAVAFFWDDKKWPFFWKGWNRDPPQRLKSDQQGRSRIDSPFWPILCFGKAVVCCCTAGFGVPFESPNIESTPLRMHHPESNGRAIATFIKKLFTEKHDPEQPAFFWNVQTYFGKMRVTHSIYKKYDWSFLSFSFLRIFSVEHHHMQAFHSKCSHLFGIRGYFSVAKVGPCKPVINGVKI